jgi:hypothetical protein
VLKQSKKTDEIEFHPLNFQKLQRAQEADKQIMKILKIEKTQYFYRISMGEERQRL